MSAETLEWLGRNTLIGFTDKRGTAWHYREGNDNHFAGAVPRDRALALLSYPLAEGAVTAAVISDDGVTTYPADGRKAIVRTDTGAVFGIFTDGYQLHQPVEWCLETVDLLLDGGLEIGSVVVLKGGAVAAVQAELGETRTAAEGVQHRPFLTAATSHDGSLASTFITGSQVVVCDNTLSTAMDAADAKVRVRHTSGSRGRVGEIRERLGLVVEQVGDRFDEQVKALTSQYVSPETWAAFTDAYAGVAKAKEGRSLSIAQNKVGVLNRLWTSDERVAPWQHSAYGVLAAVNTALHHVWGSDESRAARNQQRTLEGAWDRYDAEALKLLASL